MARGRTQGWVEQGGHEVITDGRQSVTNVQESFPLATITVFNSGTVTPSTIFSDEGGTPLANPFVADSTGFWFFWADQGRYDIQFSGAGIDSPYLYVGVDVVPSTASLADPGSNGIVVRTALGVTTARTLTQPAAGITITNPDGVAGNPTFVLANDLAAVEGLATNGIATRTATDTWTTRTITGTSNNITVANGDGVAGNPTLNIGANVVTNTGGTVTDNALVRMDGSSGRVIQQSPVIVADTSGSFTVPDGFTITDASGVSITWNVGVMTISFPTGALAIIESHVAAAQTQSSGSPQIYRHQTTYNQSGTAGSQDLAIIRVETAMGSGEHNFIRLLGGAAGATVQGRWDRLGNIYQSGNPAIIGDVNGNEQLRFVPTTSAVNEWTFTNAATGGTPTLTITGGDTNPNGRIAAKGTGRIVIPGYPYTLEVNTTDVGNVTTGLDNLQSFTVPAASLATNGDYLSITYSGVFATNDNDKRLVTSFGGQTIIDTGLQDVDGSAINLRWTITTKIIRLSATTVRATGTVIAQAGGVNSAGTSFTPSTAGGYFWTQGNILTVANMTTNPLVALVQAEGTATNDIVQNFSIIELIQRA